jgi:F-type H+-transporting ATPase subunit b
LDINATLLGQAITFAIFIWFTMKFVWPPITKAMEERQKKIADGLLAADKGQEELVVAKQEVARELAAARVQAHGILEGAQKRASQIVEEAQEKAGVQEEHMLTIAKEEIQQEKIRARDGLRLEVSGLVISCAEKLIAKEIDDKAHHELLEKLAADI